MKTTDYQNTLNYKTKYLKFHLPLCPNHCVPGMRWYAQTIVWWYVLYTQFQFTNIKIGIILFMLITVEHYVHLKHYTHTALYMPVSTPDIHSPQKMCCCDLVTFSTVYHEVDICGLNKCLHYWIYCHEILCRYSCYLQDELSSPWLFPQHRHQVTIIISIIIPVLWFMTRYMQQMTVTSSSVVVCV